MVPFIRKVHKEYPPLSSKVPPSIFPRKKKFIGEEGEREKMASRDYTNIGEKYYESLRYLSFSNSYLAQFIVGTAYSRFTLDEWKS